MFQRLQRPFQMAIANPSRGHAADHGALCLGLEVAAPATTSRKPRLTGSCSCARTSATSSPCTPHRARTGSPAGAP